MSTHDCTQSGAFLFLVPQVDDATCNDDHSGIFSSLKKLLWHSASNGNANNNNITLEGGSAPHPAALEPSSAEVACVPGVQVSGLDLNSFPRVPHHIDGVVQKRKKKRRKPTLMGDLLKHKQLQTIPTSTSENGTVNGSLDSSYDPTTLPLLSPECSPSLTTPLQSALNGHVDDVGELTLDTSPSLASTGNGECSPSPSTASLVHVSAKKRKRRSTVSVCTYVCTCFWHMPISLVGDVSVTQFTLMPTYK